MGLDVSGYDASRASVQADGNAVPSGHVSPKVDLKDWLLNDVCQVIAGVALLLSTRRNDQGPGADEYSVESMAGELRHLSNRIRGMARRLSPDAEGPMPLRHGATSPEHEPRSSPDDITLLRARRAELTERTWQLLAESRERLETIRAVLRRQ